MFCNTQSRVVRDPITLNRVQILNLPAFENNKKIHGLWPFLWKWSVWQTPTKKEPITALGFKGSRDGAVVRALASHQCGPGSIPGPGAICGLSLLLVLVPAPRVFLRVLRFSSLHKNQHFQIPIRSGIRGPQVCQSRDCYVLPSLNIVGLFFFYLKTALPYHNGG